jgi:hypothetical protein
MNSSIPCWLPVPSTRRRFLGLACASLCAGYQGLSPAAVALWESVADEALRKEITNCDLERRRIVEEAALPLTNLAVQYKAALAILKEKLQAQAKLEAVLTLDLEMNRVVTGLAIQSESTDLELAKLQRVYSSRLASFAPRYRDAIFKAETFYGGSLVSLGKGWTKAGQTAAAEEVSRMAVESGKRAVKIKEMINKQTDYLNLCNPDLCRIVSATINDGKPNVEFGKTVKRENELEFKDAIWAPSSGSPGTDVQSIISIDVPPGFNAVSVVGVGNFDSYIWSRILNYSLEADGKVIAAFQSDAKHWPRVVFLPLGTKEVRLITKGIILLW